MGSLSNWTSGTNYSAGTGTNQLQSNVIRNGQIVYGKTNNLSGTWKWMGGTTTNDGGDDYVCIAVRVA
jgi:hypothetical protein